jgi:hypothetical protein
MYFTLTIGCAILGCELFVSVQNQNAYTTHAIVGILDVTVLSNVPLIYTFTFHATVSNITVYFWNADALGVNPVFVVVLLVPLAVVSCADAHVTSMRTLE